jgi:hypothetical protein
MQNPVIGCKVNSSKFDFIPKSKEFVAEISMLSHGGVDPMGQLYINSAERGFVMVSSKTGAEVEFEMVAEQRDADGDIRFWEFRPTWADVFHNPKLRDVRVTVLND